MMQYFDRCVRVINNCHTYEQLHSAWNYVKLAKLEENETLIECVKLKRSIFTTL